MISKEKFDNIKPGDMVKIDANIDKVNVLETKYEGAPIYGMIKDMIPHNNGHWAKVKRVMVRHGVLNIETEDSNDCVEDYAYTRYCILAVAKVTENGKAPKKTKGSTVNEAWDKAIKDIKDSTSVEKAWDIMSEAIHMFIVKYFPDKPCMLIADYPNGGKGKEGGTVKIMTDM